MNCENCIYNPKIVDKLKNEAPSLKMLEDMTGVFKIFGDVTRMKILWNLFDKEMCVTEISEKAEMSQSAISHQLSGLKENGIVKSRREGKNVYYSIDDDHVQAVLDIAMTHVQHKHG